MGTSQISLLYLAFISILHICYALNVGVISIARLNSDPRIEWSTFMNNSVIEITLIGPADKWFAIGIGNSTMSNTYAFIVDENGNLYERRLGDNNSGINMCFSYSQIIRILINPKYKR